MEDISLRAEINWCVDILERIKEIVSRDVVGDDEVQAIRYLVKQGLNREDD